MRRLSLIAFIILCSAGVRIAAQSGAPNGEWRTYGGDLGSTRYAALDQINKDNFNKLEVAWRFKADQLGGRPEYNYESTPLMVNGVVYSTAGTRRAVVALDLGDHQVLGRHLEIVLSVSGRRLHDLGDVPRVRRWQEAQDRQGVVDRLAADDVDDQARLARRYLHALADGIGGAVGAAWWHGYFRLTCEVRSDLCEWPRKWRVSANSPSLWPTMFSVTKIGT